MLQAHGLDPKRFITTVAASQAAFEKSQENLLPKTADPADAIHVLFKTLRPILEAMRAQKPFDPQVQIWKNFVDEWAKQMPRD